MFINKLHATTKILQEQSDMQTLDSIWFSSITSSCLVIQGSCNMDEYLSSVQKEESSSTHTWPKTASECQTSPYTLSHKVWCTTWSLTQNVLLDLVEYISQSIYIHNKDSSWFCYEISPRNRFSLCTTWLLVLVLGGVIMLSGWGCWRTTHETSGYFRYHSFIYIWTKLYRLRNHSFHFLFSSVLYCETEVHTHHTFLFIFHTHPISCT